MRRRASLVAVAVLAALLLSTSALAVWRLNRPYPQRAAVVTDDPHYGSAVIDARGPLAYHRGHAKGARELYARSLLSYTGRVGGVLAEPASVADRLHALGLAPGEKVLVYGAGDGRDAGLVALVLQAYGVAARLLRGGVTALPGPLTRAVPVVTPTTAPFQRDPRLLVAAADAPEHLRENAVAPVDVRPAARYGEGHVTGAIDLPAADLLPGGHLPRYATLDARLQRAHITRLTHVLVYGDDLRDAAAAWLALSAYGVRRVHVLSAPYPALIAAGAPTSRASAQVTTAEPNGSLCWK